jgi:hypothetical protein
MASMPPFLLLIQRLAGLRGAIASLPGWAKAILAIVSLPGLLLLALSLVAVAVSILALLLLTVPVYRLLQMFGAGGQRGETDGMAGDQEVDVRPTRRHVEVKIID